MGLLSLDTCVDRLRSDALLCAEITWSLFGITLPEWSLLAFTGIALLPLYPLERIQPLAGWQKSGRVLNACMNFISCVP